MNELKSSDIAKRARERHAEMEHKGWDYRSFYNGWLECFAEYFTPLIVEWDALRAESAELKKLVANLEKTRAVVSRRELMSDLIDGVL